MHAGSQNRGPANAGGLGTARPEGVREMAVYVDKMKTPHRGMIMCHMIADDVEELHAMAARLGLKREWFQLSNRGVPHYDICQSKKALALRYGAQELGRRAYLEVARRFYEDTKSQATKAKNSFKTRQQGDRSDLR